jgi:hypothetical protein
MRSVVRKLIAISLLTGVFSTFSQDLSNPYNPEPKMDALKVKTGNDVTQMHFLVFGDAKGGASFPNVLKRADSLNPQFCITTADLVNFGVGEQGKKDYAQLDKDGGWFFRKYPMWPTVGNHEESVMLLSAYGRKLYGNDHEAGVKNFSNFFGMKSDMYSFEYGNAKFIALPWTKILNNPVDLAWLEDELKSGQGKHIFIFKHRPHYTLGNKSYEDVEGKETATTKLYDKYKVTAVFSGHDHIYYRTKRNGVNYIISAGAGAPIYPLNREKDAIGGDVYYGMVPPVNTNAQKSIAIAYKFHAADGTETAIAEEMFYVLSVKVDGEKVSIEMVDEKNGKVWDKADIK